jgi:tRNA A37 methylthiotransferase MiaB
MTDEVDDRTRKTRAAELLSMAAAFRAEFAAAHVGREASVLFETRLDDGRWMGHAEDHTLVAVAPDDRRGLENAIGRVFVTGTDPDVPDRAIGRVLATDPPGRTLRAPLPVLLPSIHGGTDGR